MTRVENNPIKVAFICLGNICRSPLAHYLFQALVQEMDLSQKFLIDSAGTGGHTQGSPADPRSISVTKKYSVEGAYPLIQGHRAKKITTDTLLHFDYLLVMDEENYHDVLSLYQQAIAKVKTGHETYSPIEDRLFYFGNCSKKNYYPSTSRQQHFNSKNKEFEANIMVEDPYYGDSEGFKDTLDLCLQAAKGLLNFLNNNTQKSI